MNPKIWELWHNKVSTVEGHRGLIKLLSSGISTVWVARGVLDMAVEKLPVYMRFVNKELDAAGVENVYYPKDGYFEMCEKSFRPVTNSGSFVISKKEKPLRKLEIGQHRFTEVNVMDEPGDGGANHEYAISRVCTPCTMSPTAEFGSIKFQKGPVKENGVNGCFQEDLIAIVIDRLQCFQAGDFACRENALALTKLEEALHWLNHRTADRQVRGVEGKSEL